MLDYKFHHLSSRFTAGWKTEEEKREKTEGESMKTPRKCHTTAKGKSKKMERRERKSAKQTEKWKKRATKRKKTSLMQSWERAVFSPRFLVALYKTGGSVRLGNDRMVGALGQH